MAQRFELHPTHPQARLIAQAVKLIQGGALAVVPTDACYALVCHLGDKQASERLRAIRGIDEKHLLTILCADLSQLSSYAMVDNRQYRFLKHWTPGPYTFVLQATKEVPKRLAHPQRRTIGLRVPTSPVVHELLAQLGEPVLASTLRLPQAEQVLSDPDEIIEQIGRRIDLLLDVGTLGREPTTIIEFTDDGPLIRRAGLGAQEIADAGGRIAF
jgi:tRNA threonylcarbamoyl adenosine modification protein (Sua5/YciO/YrdC/YwlC family)